MVAARNALRGLAVTGHAPASCSGTSTTPPATSRRASRGRWSAVTTTRTPGAALGQGRAPAAGPGAGRQGRTLPLPGGVLLGLDPDADYEEARTQLRLGDTLLLFTDGLIERRTGSISDALSDFAAAGRPRRPGPGLACRPDPRKRVSDTGDDACLVVVRIL